MAKHVLLEPYTANMDRPALCMMFVSAGSPLGAFADVCSGETVHGTCCRKRRQP